jgi:hypothetical protein
MVLALTAALHLYDGAFSRLLLTKVRCEPLSEHTNPI